MFPEELQGGKTLYLRLSNAVNPNAVNWTICDEGREVFALQWDNVEPNSKKKSKFIHDNKYKGKVSVSLQPEEIVKSKSPSKNVSKDTSSRSMTVARYHEVTLGLTHSQLILPIPLHITPAFDIDEVSLKWRLHFEFVTTNEKIYPNNEDKDWKAPSMCQ